METLDEEALGRSGQWSDSRFGDLERFMVDFLVGGAAAGESLRLKLQTPLFVADALLEAARQQLSSELSTAQQVPPCFIGIFAPQPQLRSSKESHCCCSLQGSYRQGWGRRVDFGLTTGEFLDRGDSTTVTVPI